jgi:PEP-CTERM motif
LSRGAGAFILETAFRAPTLESMTAVHAHVNNLRKRRHPMGKRLVRLALLAALAAVLVTVGAQCGFANELISAGFTNSNYPGSYSGVEPLAAAANPAAFGAASFWNPLTLGFLSPTLSPSYSNLQDSGGNPTTVGLQFSGLVDSYTCGACAFGVFGDFIYLNGGVLDWQLTGLVPDSVANLYFYGFGTGGQSYRTFNMALDTTGGGTLNGTYTVDSVTGAYAANITVSPTGTISGEMQVPGGQASWSGFQVDDSTPEPSTLALFGIGMALAAIRRTGRRLRP